MGKRLTAAERIQKRAAELVLRGWCKGALARDSKGNELYSAFDKSAVRFCMIGALERAAGKDLTTIPDVVRAVEKRCGSYALGVVNDRLITRQQAAELLWPGSTKEAK